MNPNQSFKKQILDLILNSEGVSAKQIQKKLEISQPTLFKHLKKLILEDKIQKIGSVPNVFYVPLKKDNLNLIQDFSENNLQSEIKQAISDNFLYISPEGRIFNGFEGFVLWCQKRSQKVFKTAVEYYQIFQKYNKFKENGIIKASFKIRESFGKESYFDELFYLDFYAIERFGRTKLAELSFQAKQSQDSKILNKIMEMVNFKIRDILIKYKIDAVGFIPPTVNRKVQFQKELEQKLALPLPHLKLLKLIIETPVQQKSLKSKEDRVLNAKQTIFVNDERIFENILLIDDFVGSGSTLNQTAKKIKAKKLAKKNVYGLGLTGSLKGFEVINQV